MQCIPIAKAIEPDVPEILIYAVRRVWIHTYPPPLPLPSNPIHMNHARLPET